MTHWRSRATSHNPSNQAGSRYRRLQEPVAPIIASNSAARLMKPSSSSSISDRRPATTKTLSMMAAAIMMMTTTMSLLLFVTPTADAFQGVVRIGRQHHHTSLAMIIDMPPRPPAVVVLAPTLAFEQGQQQLPPGKILLQQAAASTSVTMDQTPSMLLSIQEYRKPTPEEIAQKKLKYVLLCYMMNYHVQTTMKVHPSHRDDTDVRRVMGRDLLTNLYVVLSLSHNPQTRTHTRTAKL